MGLKILHSADWHMDSPFAGFRPEQQEYLKRELRQVPGKIAELCRRENCDLVLLSGDIFDNATCRESAGVVREALKSCGVPVLIAPGNHDYLTTGSPWLEEQWPDNVYIFTAGLSSVALPKLGCRIYGAGYRTMDCPALLENFRAGSLEQYRLAVLHADPMRMQSPYCPVTAAQVRDSGLDYLALGHVHKSGSFRTPGTLCGWPGAPMGRGFDETREKGVYIVELGEKTDFRFVALDTPRFFSLEVDTDSQDLEAVLPPAENMDFYRVTLTGSGGEPMWRLKESYRDMPNLEIIDHREEKQNIWDRAEMDSLEGTYFRLLREKLLNAQGSTVNESPEARKIRIAAEIAHKILEGREVVL